MYIQNKLQRQKTAKTSLVSFKDRVESFSRKTLLASAVIGSGILMPMAVSSYMESVAAEKNAPHSALHSMNKGDSASVGKLGISLGIFALAYSGVILYTIRRKKRYDREHRVAPEELESIRRQKISRWVENRY